MNRQPRNSSTPQNTAQIGPRKLKPIIGLILTIAFAIAVIMGWLPKPAPTTPASTPASSQSTTATAPSNSPAAPTTPSRAASSAPTQPPSSTTTAARAPSSTASGEIARLFREQKSDTWVETGGVVDRLLPDDRETADGSDMHQRFILRTDDGINVLIAHNITTSDRVPAKPGDRLTLRGEYEWTEKGGTIHFTHKPKYATRDPSRTGWIEHAGIRYE